MKQFIWILLLLCAVLVLHVVSVSFDVFLITPAIITGHSMEPTLRDGQLVLVLNDDIVQIQRGDIVAAYMQCQNITEFVSKRIVAVPGDTVNGQVLPPNMYWIEGDNKEHSVDSRTCGPITRDQIQGVILWY